MLVTRVGSRIIGLKNVFRQTKRTSHDVAHGGHGHEAPFGPIITYDYMPVPCKPYGVVHNEIQKKFNMFLGLSVLFSIGSAIIFFNAGALGRQNRIKPLSYVEQFKGKK